MALLWYEGGDDGGALPKLKISLLVGRSRFFRGLLNTTLLGRRSLSMVDFDYLKINY